MPKGKKKFCIKPPHGDKITIKRKGSELSAELKWSPGFSREKAEGFSKAQGFVDSECIRKMNPETPRRTGMLIKSATLGTVIGSGEINQITPYARKQYYEHKEKSYWFERMKNRHKDTILKGAAEYVKSH